MPGYRVKLVRTATRHRGRGLVVGFKLAVTNRGERPLRFDRDRRSVVLMAPRLDDLAMESARELPTAGSASRRIRPGRTRSVWVGFAVPSVVLPQLREPIAALIFMPRAGGQVSGLPHLGQIRLWRVSTAAGVKTLAGLRD
jgi:hypothetical protein